MTTPNYNKHGLSREIPPEIKLKIRQRDGFGCVVCGVGLIEYEHVDPEFKDAKEHDVDCMTILCPTCHAKKTRGFLSTESIKLAMKSPKALEQGYSKEVLDIGKGQPSLIFAGSKFSNCIIPVMISQIPLFEIKPPETTNGPFRFSARFYDTKGDNTLTIIDNEWRASTSNWDLEVSAGKIRIRESQKEIHLILQNVNANTVEVQTIRSVIGNKLIVGDRTQFQILDLTMGNILSTFKNFDASNCMVGLML